MVQVAPPLVERNTPTSLARNRSFGSVGSTLMSRIGTSGRLFEMFVQVTPASVVRKTCFEGRPRKPANVAYALRPSAVTETMRVTTAEGSPEFLREKVAERQRRNAPRQPDCLSKAVHCRQWWQRLSLCNRSRSKEPSQTSSAATRSHRRRTCRSARRGWCRKTRWRVPSGCCRRRRVYVIVSVGSPESINNGDVTRLKVLPVSDEKRMKA